MIVASMLGVATRRSHNLLLSQAAAERERANLARYFSPNVVEELSHNDEPLKKVRNQNVAVLFVDIVGFTTFAAQRSPQEVIETLREFHDLMERQVFSHEGTLDKYLGDGLMATFGTPVAGGSDATNALECVRAMTTSLESWNQDRQQKGAARNPCQLRVALRRRCPRRYWCQQAGICRHRQHGQCRQPTGGADPPARRGSRRQRCFGRTRTG